MRWALMVSCLGLVSLAACATKGGDGDDSSLSSDELEDAVLAPAEDLNLRRDEIPAILTALDTPYDTVEGAGCAAILTEVEKLTEVLGPDEDEIKNAKDSTREKISKAANDVTLNTVEDATTSFIPFRSLVRRATGASAYEKKVRAAYQRGLMRRSYLKGRGEELGCPVPASPTPPPEEEK